ncbi:MAG TPA: hypothetical protein PLH76_05390, partial [Rectinema sp.]|nr:hypothetical protein [Rectinema sp.]
MITLAAIKYNVALKYLNLKGRRSKEFRFISKKYRKTGKGTRTQATNSFSMAKSINIDKKQG